MTVDNPDDPGPYKQALFVKASKPTKCKRYYLGYDPVDISGFTESHRSFISPYTNPPFLKKDESIEEIGIRINGKMNDNSLNITFYDNTENFYLITQNTTWEGQIFLDEDVTVTNGAQLTILAGTEIYLDNGVGILVDNSGSCIVSEGTSSKSIKFTSSQTNPSPGDWDGIELRGAGNVFEYTILEYANNPLYFRNADNTVDYCTIRHNASYGIRTFNLNSGTYARLVVSNSSIRNNGNHGVFLGHKSRVGINYSEIKSNSGNGIYVYSAHLGNPNQTGSGYFRKNYIFGNSKHAVRVGSGGRVYDGYGSKSGNNVYLENGSHAIKLDNSISARWFDDGASRSEVNAVASLKYVYNLAQTQSGETTVSWQVPMQYNAWNVHANPNYQGNKFYGPVDFNPYRTGHIAGSVGPQNSVPTQSLDAPKDPLVLASLAVVQSETDGLANNTERDAYVYNAEQVEKLKARINNDPASKYVPSWMNGLLGYYNELPGDTKKGHNAKVQSYFGQFVADAHRSQTSNKAGRAYPLVSQAVMALELHQDMQEGHARKVLNNIRKYESTFTNLDVKREIGFIKIQALHELGFYQEILGELDYLSEISRLGLDPSNTTNDYQTLKDTYTELAAGKQQRQRIRPCTRSRWC